MPKKSNLILTNNKIKLHFQIIDTFEAGLVLVGNEVKSLMLKQANIEEAYVSFYANEAFLTNCYIHNYHYNQAFKKEPRRKIKLLLHKKEILKYQLRSQKNHMTIIPKRLYWKHKKIKVELAFAKGKKQFEKRQQILERDYQRKRF